MKCFYVFYDCNRGMDVLGKYTARCQYQVALQTQVNLDIGNSKPLVSLVMKRESLG